ncbi:hypothetical protein GDO86_002899 [Hymenochirus boettgeri]|uniref:CENP-V/GFA domain-containing protein n=1 Tax=Hymenochirus boettgeri TaxID=247094 RepID=A0A8T2K1D0_9PIPI|nr:hypothetical protein GDO86_002899 [Hymenochirus boettgeri]
MVKAKKAAGKGGAAERQSKRTGAATGALPGVTRPAPQPPSAKKGPGKKVVKKQVEEKEEEEVQRCQQPLLLDLGTQKQRWVNFAKEQSLSTEEAAKLLLEYFCSICVKKQNRHFIVPSSRFKLLKGADNLTTYKFNTKKAQHTFCKTCGVQSFYTPRSNPDGYGIAPHCLDEGTVRSVHVEQINGKEWEKAMKEHKTIRSMSQS